MNPLLHTGAFVVQFRRGTRFSSGQVQGRIEHVASGWSAWFDSRKELIERLAEAFDEIERLAQSADSADTSSQQD
jgi:mannitol/fructose-specific phosphotransferase system IIA component